MELLLEVRVGVDENAARIDCRVSADPAVSVGEVVSALVAHAKDREVSVDAEAALWTEGGDPLDPGTSLRTSGVRSGALVWLAATQPPATSAPVDVEVAVLGSGVATSPGLVLAAGTHHIDDEGGFSTQDAPPLAVVTVATSGDVEIVSDAGQEWYLEAEDLDGVGRSVAIGSRTLRVRRLRNRDTVDASGGVAFNRTPYRPVPVRRRELDALPPPPGPPPASRIALTSFLVPLVSGVGFAVVLGRPQFLLLALAAPVVLVVVGLVEKRRGRTGARAAHDEYIRLVDQTLAAIEQATRDETADRLRSLPALDDLALDARSRRPTLWARGRESPDLLSVRLGLGTARSAVFVDLAPGGDDDSRAEVRARLDAASALVHEVPVALDIERAGIVGIHDDTGLEGGRTHSSPAAALGRAVLGQIVARQGPEDVVVAGLLAPVVLWEFEWLRWLPHVRSAASPLPGGHLALWPESVSDLLGSLLDVAADRASVPGAVTSFPRIVVVIHEEAPVDRAALGRLLDVAPAAGIRILWIGRHRDLLPRQCRVVVSVSEGSAASTVVDVDPDVDEVRFTAELAEVATVDALARDLAPLRDVSSVARTGALPRTVGLAEVLVDALDGAVTPTEVAAAWLRSDGSSLAAPLGVGPEGVLSLDLVAHGPHALIAGTSGAGKSELLQSMVASMAACHPPQRLTFLFVDYKGGAAAAPFAGLPHQVGVVTNLDARLSRRALTSLGAELDRRMALIAEYDDPAVKDLGDLSRVDPDGCPPRLVLVVDEFATLVKEIPDFVAGVVDIAQRGRSLGIHLVLATQRPAGAVNENILANTNLRIALRVVDKADSQNVIGSGEAADIPLPLRGRGFARFGPSDLIPFQSAWSGAPRRPGGAPRVEVRPFGVEAVAPPTAHDPTTETQLDVVLDAIHGAFGASGGASPRRPWLPPLDEVVDLAAVEVDSPPSDRGRLAVIGVRDDPAHQRRVPAVVDLERDGGLAVFGTGGSGRSTVLRTVAASLVRDASIDDVQLIAFDFAGRGLLSLQSLPHTRLVATSDDLEATARVIDMLVAEIAHRRTILGEASCDTLGALRARRVAPVVPRLVVLIDGFGSLRAELDQPAGYDWLHRLQRVVLDGRSVGIHVVLTADRRTDLPSATLGVIGGRLVLRMPDPEAMASLGVPMALARASDLPAGRGFLADAYEVQVAVVGGDPASTAQADSIAAIASSVSSGQVAPRVVPLPDRVERPNEPDQGLRLTFGIADGGAPASVDLGPGHMLVVGPPGSGRTTALAALVDALLRPRVRPVRVVVIASPHGGLATVGQRWGLETAITTEEQASVLDDVLATTDAASGPPSVVIVVDDGDDLDEVSVGRRIEQLAGTHGVRIVAATTSGSATRAFSGWLPVVRRGRRMLVLQPDDAAEVDHLAGVRMRFRPGSQFPKGRGVLVADRRPTVVQVGLTNEQADTVPG